jgi:ABC-type antimicrobial peptide transport system permease subunit
VARRLWRTTFVVAEVAFVSALLVCATLIISSYIRVTGVDLGFDRSRLLVAIGDTGVDPANAGPALQRLQQLPGVASVGAVGLASPPLVMGGFRTGGATIKPLRSSDASPETRPVLAELRSVSDGYFAAAGISVLSGRVFDTRARAAREAPIVIDEEVAQALFGQGDAIGARIDDLSTRGNRRTVVGVVRHIGTHGPERRAMPQIYVPLGSGTAGPIAGVESVQFIVRTTTRPASVVPAIRAALPRAATNGRTALQVRPAEDAFRNITAERRFNARLMSVFGAIAIVIGAAGIYSVMASTIAQQARDWSIRIALGATPGRVVRHVLAGACRYLAVGLGIGLGAGWWASRGMESLLFDITPTDASTYGIVAATLMATGVTAALLAAVRATRTAPAAVLRSE